MKNYRIFIDLHKHLVGKIKENSIQWNSLGIYTMQVVGKKEAFSLYRRKSNDIGEHPQTFFDSTLNGKTSDCNFQGYHYYWFIEEIQAE
ncbi:hypothetical protein [Sphingobacterium multivorum]|uniref:hypothetical protein n=1 Tax=Sphingobacterium multivorum TaxID=28454 RepID=UPI0028A5DEBE|nr:hypothetical protein [Sphingobacterium multivorum]